MSISPLVVYFLGCRALNPQGSNLLPLGINGVDVGTFSGRGPWLKQVPREAQ